MTQTDDDLAHPPISPAPRQRTLIRDSCARTDAGAFSGARRAAWYERHAHTGRRRAKLSRPGRETCSAGRRDALQVTKRKDATSGVVLLRHRWLVAHRGGWVKRLRRVARDNARISQTLAAAGFCRRHYSPSAPMRQLYFNGHNTLWLGYRPGRSFGVAACWRSGSLTVLSRQTIGAGSESNH